MPLTGDRRCGQGAPCPHPLLMSGGRGAGEEVVTAPHASPLAQVVRYQAGYVVCAVIAGLYLLAMPAAGLCFCCALPPALRGSSEDGAQDDGLRRAVLVTFLLLTTLVLL